MCMHLIRANAYKIRLSLRANQPLNIICIRHRLHHSDMEVCIWRLVAVEFRKDSYLAGGNVIPEEDSETIGSASVTLC